MQLLSDANAVRAFVWSGLPRAVLLFCRSALLPLASVRSRSVVCDDGYELLKSGVRNVIRN